VHGAGLADSSLRLIYSVYKPCQRASVTSASDRAPHRLVPGVHSAAPDRFQQSEEWPFVLSARKIIVLACGAPRWPGLFMTRRVSKAAVLRQSTLLAQQPLSSARLSCAQLQRVLSAGWPPATMLLKGLFQASSFFRCIAPLLPTIGREPFRFIMGAVWRIAANLHGIPRRSGLGKVWLAQQLSWSENAFSSIQRCSKPPSPGYSWQHLI